MWISRGEHRRLVRAVLRAERRVDRLTAAFAEERAENRRAERWWADMLLRAKQTYPLPAKPVVQQPADSPPLEPVGEVPDMDAGELEAVVATGINYGVPRDETIRLLRRERGLE